MLEEYRREVLPNGLRVLGVENPALHSFVCSAYVHAGARFESPEETGLTHFLEHMLMQGSENFPTFNDIMRRVEDMGGVVNAHTYPEHMKVTFGVHRKHWRRVMEVASDVILRPTFDPDEVEQEKSIIAQEISRHRDTAGRNISVYELAYGLLLKEKLDESGIRGCPDIMRTFDREMVRRHYRRFFVPQNMVLCLAGGFDFDEVVGEMDSYFGAMSPGDDGPELSGPEVEHRRARAFYRPTEALPVVESLLCYHAYPMGDERFDALRAIAQMLGGGLTSRLFSRVREERGLVYEIESYLQPFSDVGALNVFLSVDRENLIDAVETTLGVVREVAMDNFDDDELERYKESARCGMEILCDHASRLTDWFGKQELFLGLDEVMTPEDYIRRQEALALEYIHEVIGEVFTAEGANLAVAGPFDEETQEELRALFSAEEVECEPVREDS
jgi:predicted Zn-dependent peptidase